MNLLFADVFLSNLIICTTATIVDRLNAVVRQTTTAYPMYLLTRKANIDSKTNENIDSKMKNRICLSIMGSSEYLSWGRKPVDMYKISDNTILLYRDIFENLYEFNDNAFVYTNPTERMIIPISESEFPFPEDVFICVSRKLSSEGSPDFQKHLVSKQYNMNFASDSSRNYIAGRFVFYDIGTDIEAMAEEPAKALLPSYWPGCAASILSFFLPYVEEHRNTSRTLNMNVERLYLLRRRKNEPAKNDFDDPLCALDEDERYRLCGLIFNSEYFDGKVEYPSSNSVVQEGCRKNVISFKRDDVRAEVGSKQYSEWMIICYLSHFPYNYETEFDKVYFLSRAYDDSNNALSSNDVFVYNQDSDGRNTFLVNMFTNVRLAFYEF